MGSKSALIYIMDGNKLVGLEAPQPTAAHAAPTPCELELVRIFKEHGELKSNQRTWGKDLIFHHCVKGIAPYPRLLCSVCPPTVPIDGSTDFNAYEKLKEFYAG